MLCPNCKKEIENDSNFCEHCGIAITTEQLTINKANDSQNDLIEISTMIGIILAIIVLFGSIIIFHYS